MIVVDARGAWSTTERFPDADEIHQMHADDYLKAHPLGTNAYVAVLSHDPKLDDPAIIGALQSPARYVGAIGSGKTQGARRKRLEAAGLTDEQIGRLFGPIGLEPGRAEPGGDRHLHPGADAGREEREAGAGGRTAAGPRDAVGAATLTHVQEFHTARQPAWR